MLGGNQEARRRVSELLKRGGKWFILYRQACWCCCWFYSSGWIMSFESRSAAPQWVSRLRLVLLMRRKVISHCAVIRFAYFPGEFWWNVANVKVISPGVWIWVGAKLMVICCWNQSPSGDVERKHLSYATHTPPLSLCLLWGLVLLSFTNLNLPSFLSFFLFFSLLLFLEEHGSYIVNSQEDEEAG